MRLWSDVFQEKFPETKEMPPLSHVIERFGRPAVPEVRLQVKAGVSVPRYWFKSTDGTELVQVQCDRFIRNWRRLRTKMPYPRFDVLKDRFADDLRQLVDFVDTKGMGAVEPNQCEVTYVNDILAGEGWDDFGDLGNVVTVWQPSFSDDFLANPEEARFATSFLIPGESEQPVGRLHVSMEPKYRLPDMRKMLRLSLTARGAPVGEGIDGVTAFLDVGHVWIVKGFASITTERMHKIWRRTRDR